MSSSPSFPPPDGAPAPWRRLGRRVLGDWWLAVDGRTLRADALAGLLGAVLVLPQGIAFAALAGLPPQYGLYTAIVPCIVAALFGSSWHVVSGPTNANSLALFAMLSPLALVGSGAYVELALMVTLLVGVMQWLVGVLRLGALANFISPSVLMGFTHGAALLIAIHALKDVLGLENVVGHRAWQVVQEVAADLGLLQPESLAVALLTLLVALALRRWRPRWPGMLLALLAGTLAAVFINTPAWHPPWSLDAVRTVGEIPSPWPQPSWPLSDLSRLADLAGMAFALTIVALGQSVSMAKAVAQHSGQRIDINREFAGQGLSNIVGSFFSCYVSCGSVNRSLPNLQAGARTPLAAVFSALLLLALVALLAPQLGHIPMAGVAGLLLLVAWNLLDGRRWRWLWANDRRECLIAGLTLVATLTLRLEMAIVLGTMVSLLAYLYRTSHPVMRSMGFGRHGMDRRFEVLEGHAHPLPECPQLKLLRMEGEIYFGATPSVSDRLHALRATPDPQKHLLVMAKSMNFIDLAGGELWEAELQARRALGGDLYFHRPRPQVVALWTRTGFLERLGADHVYPDKRTAIGDIYRRLDPAICRQCTARTFVECRSEWGAPGSVGRRTAAASGRNGPGAGL
ncbi:MAG: SulP family inorganic anion transporter [Comamonas sp.]